MLLGIILGLAMSQGGQGLGGGCGAGGCGGGGCCGGGGFGGGCPGIAGGFLNRGGILG
ncbi:MAG: hypothetical protein KC910_23405 [Candidatus Eremiobacteraeota bacterium]|nr:hypothetical protein [Candidatus Eremiobacteraeota bacterium]